MNVNLSLVEPYTVSERSFNDNMIYLDWNESPFQPEPVIEYFKKNPFIEYNLYPDPTNVELINCLAKYTNAPFNLIEVFNGSDSALDYSLRTLLNIGDKVLIPYPNYSQINQTITFLGSQIVYCQIENIEVSISNDIKLVYLSIPNNPIGYCLDLSPLIKKYPKVYFIIDEAYHEFAPEYSLFEKASLFTNLIVVRTFSKALCLASLRLGYLTSNSNILEKIKLIKNNKEINRLAQIAGIVTLQNIEWYQEKISQILKNKANFISSIVNKSNIEIYASKANFILIKHPDVKKIIAESKKIKMLIRDRSSFISNTARITIGTEESMKKLAYLIQNL